MQIVQTHKQIGYQCAWDTRYFGVEKIACAIFTVRVERCQHMDLVRQVYQNGLPERREQVQQVPYGVASGN